jgi:membrane protease YdiL (CAAX protease family)
MLRIALLGGALQVAEFCCVTMSTHHLHTTVSGLFAIPISLLLPMLLPAIALAFAIYWAGARFLERRSLRELPFGSALPTLAVGVLSGFLLCGFVFCALAVQGSVTYETYSGFGRAPAAAVIFIAGVIYEELIFRGTILRISEESLGTARALMLSALLFAASHLGNVGVSAISVLALFAGGIALGLAYCLSRNLWLPIGAHFGWNFTLGSIFGPAVSGHEAHGTFKFGLSGPDWLTGGSFGPESSIVSMTFLILLAIALWWHGARHRGWTPSRFRTRAP